MGPNQILWYFFKYSITASNRIYKLLRTSLYQWHWVYFSSLGLSQCNHDNHRLKWGECFLFVLDHSWTLEPNFLNPHNSLAQYYIAKEILNLFIIELVVGLWKSFIKAWLSWRACFIDISFCERKLRPDFQKIHFPPVWAWHYWSTFLSTN